MREIDKHLMDAVENGADRITNTLRDLIAFPSIVPTDSAAAGPAERECQEYLRGRLAVIGFTCDLWEPDGPALYEKYKGRPGANKGRVFGGRPILAGRLPGSGGGKSIMLTGHIDVVTPGSESHWQTDPFQAALKDGFLFGRGAVDMKGGVASMLMATEFLQEIDIQLQGDIVFSTVVDEEIGGMGTLALVDRGHQADAGIMTEATALAVSPLCHGILWGRIKINGIGGHAELKPASWDEGGPVDAVWLTRQILDGIDILNRRWANEGCKNHPLMDLPNQIIVTQVNVGEHPSSMAGVGEIVIDVQYLPQERDKAGLGGHVQREVEEHISRICRVDPFLRKNPAKVEWILDADCTELATDHPIVETTRDAISAIGHKPQLWGLGAHADIGTLTELGQTPTINFGPGNPIQAHQPNECVSVSDLVAATQILALTIERWCA